MSETLRNKVSILLIFPVGTIDFLEEKRTITDFTQILKDRTLAVHYLSMLERNNLVKSEMAITEPATETKKGKASRVFWATEECLNLNQALKIFLMEHDSTLN